MHCLSVFFSPFLIFLLFFSNLNLTFVLSSFPYFLITISLLCLVYMHSSPILSPSFLPATLPLTFLSFSSSPPPPTPSRRECKLIENGREPLLASPSPSFPLHSPLHSIPFPMPHSPFNIVVLSPLILLYEYGVPPLPPSRSSLHSPLLFYSLTPSPLPSHSHPTSFFFLHFFSSSLVSFFFYSPPPHFLLLTCMFFSTLCPPHPPPFPRSSNSQTSILTTFPSSSLIF